MNWHSFNTHNESYQNAFETMCNQLFEKYLLRNHPSTLNKFRVINSAGGDGGIEAYGELNSNEIIAIQSKWFRDVLKSSQFSQIEKSIKTALQLRPNIKEYIICVPRNLNSIKFGRGKKGESKKPIKNNEEKSIESFELEIQKQFPSLIITWWFEKDLDLEFQQTDNEGIFKFWFENEILIQKYLKEQFELQKAGWLYNRYIPELHGQGKINEEYQKLCFSQSYRDGYLKDFVGKIITDIHLCNKLITQFQKTIDCSQNITKRLEVIKRNLDLFLNGFKNTLNAVKQGNDYYKPTKIKEVWLWNTKTILEKIKPANNQKGILPDLIKALDKIHKHDLENTYINRWIDFNQGIRLILGEAGTGKTHGLTNCVEQQLIKGAPALIIQAKGTQCNNWSEILSNALKLNSWNEDEIFNALSTLAINNDSHNAHSYKAGEEPFQECTKVLICVDGLDEDFWHKKEWYSRIRECEILVKKYPRLKFLFSARRYFYDNTEVPKRGSYDDIILSREGDISISEIAPKYFSKDHYNIELSNISLINGIDSLFALRLFCEEYQNQKLNEKSDIKRATRQLLNSKIERINTEFIDSLAPKKISSIYNPIKISLKVISNHFYTNLNIDEETLFSLLIDDIGKILENNEILLIIEKLVENGILLCYYSSESSNILDDPHKYYNVTYQSIIEHIISEQTYSDIVSNKIKKIPEILFKGMVRPLDYVFDDANPASYVPLNHQIIQNIINNIFIDTGRLIGIDNFLIDGFSSKDIFEMQMQALTIAPKELAMKFKKNVDQMFFKNYQSRFKLLKHLILPSSNSNKKCFGAEYLHDILINQPSSLERDRLWSGLDPYERRDFSEEQTWTYTINDLSSLFDDSGMGVHLSEYYKHNELPLVYAWGLSTLDQKLRNSLRIALTEWAIENPLEFKLLLDKIFSCNDPQIQEDLAAIMLGVASRLTKHNMVLELSKWAISNVFPEPFKYRNIIIRQGFRAITERAYMLGLISKNDIDKCRPTKNGNLELIDLDISYLKTCEEEHYPIVHDLAWYVIGRVYNDFIDNDCKESVDLLEAYRLKYANEHINKHSWTMAAAIAYIRSLGFDRTKGNGFTDATHGSKSSIFTYEEKYTWIAVHYLQGYLSDNIPLKHWSGKRIFIQDYSQITDIPNPSEKIIDLEHIWQKFQSKKEWVIKENLAKEFDNGSNITEQISKWVKSDSKISHKRWLLYDDEDFAHTNSNRKWIALYHHCGLHDSKEYVYSFLDARACFINKNDFNAFIKLLAKDNELLDSALFLDSLQTSPKTGTYSNPSDIVWMPWIEEEGEKFNIENKTGQNITLFPAITKVLQYTVEGEESFMLPSKLTRNLLNICSLVKSDLLDKDGNLNGFSFEKDKNSFQDNQQILLIDYHKLQIELDKRGLRIIWVLEHLRQKNALNKELDEDFRAQKVRKFVIWNEDNSFTEKCFWDETFSNHRDKINE